MGNSSGIRFGIIGAGVAAETHARELRHVPGASLQAVFARNAEKAERFRSTFSIPSAYSDLEPFLRDRTIDIVIVATPNGLHRDYALSVAAAGKHVVVEKPLEMSVPRAEDIILACKNAGRRLFVIYQRRHAEATQQARLDILNGKLGKIILINIIDNQFRHPRYYSESHWRGTREQEGGGCIITQSTHLIDLAQYLLGPIVSVFAYTQTALHSIETEDSAVAVFKFANGAFGTLSSSTAAYPGLRHLITISGTEGSIIINGEHDQIVFRASAHDANFIDYHAGFSFLDPIDPRNYPTFGQRAQLQQIVASLNNTGLRSEPDEYELLQALYVSDALYRSAAEGRSVTISQHLKS